MLSSELVERALRLAYPVVSEEMAAQLRSALLAQISNALLTFSHRAAKEGGYEGLQKDFSATPVAGVVDLTALSGIIFDLARSRVRVSSSNEPIEAVDSLELLTSGSLVTGVPLYAQDGTDLRFRDASGVMGAYVTPVKIKANYVLTLNDVPNQYEALLVETLAGLLGAPLNEQRAREMARDSRA